LGNNYGFLQREKQMGTRLKAKFYVNVRNIIGKKEMEINLDGEKAHTIRDVIEKIDNHAGNGFKEKAMGTEARPGGSIRIVLNGKMIDALKRFDTEVKTGDEVAFFPLIAGG
jgi:MoaD family protein